jgi:hypothetical protein
MPINENKEKSDVRGFLLFLIMESQFNDGEREDEYMNGGFRSVSSGIVDTIKAQRDDDATMAMMLGGDECNVWSEEPLLKNGASSVPVSPLEHDAHYYASAVSSPGHPNTAEKRQSVITIDYYPSTSNMPSLDSMYSDWGADSFKQQSSILDIGPRADPEIIGDIEQNSGAIHKEQSTAYGGWFSWKGSGQNQNDGYSDALYNRFMTRTANMVDVPGLSSPKRSYFLGCIPRPNSSHKRTLKLLLLQSILVFLLFNIPGGMLILYPIHIIGVLFHELGHAFMAWITGARIVSIRIGPNIDGLTQFIGGKFCMICPAGYLGASIAGGSMILCAFSQKASLYMAWIMIFCFGFAAAYAADFFSLFVPILMISFFVLFLHFGGKQRDRYLRWIISMMGVTASAFSIWDIIEDLVFRTVPQSDAYQFATHCIYSPAIFVGLIWCCLAILFVSFFILLGMKMFSRVTSMY